MKDQETGKAGLTPPGQSSRLGTAACMGCGILWGLLPVYWILLEEVDPMYILASRIIWSAVFMLIFMAVTGKLGVIRETLRTGKNILICFISGLLISVNWGTYIYAVNNGHVLDASMGYFVEPVVVAFMGMLLFRESMNRYEKVTLGCAIAGMIYMMARSGIFPLIALILALSFAAYGAVKKSLELTASVSLLMETLLMTPFALIFTVHAETGGRGAVGVLSGPEWILIPLCGVITSVPLLLFNVGVKNIPYYLVGILEYVSPTLSFILGILYFHEEIDMDRLIAFIIIWTGIGFTVFDRVVHRKS